MSYGTDKVDFSKMRDPGIALKQGFGYLGKGFSDLGGQAIDRKKREQDQLLNKTKMDLANTQNTQMKRDGVLKQKKFASDERAKATKTKELEMQKQAMVSGFRKLHPKTTEGLSDAEIFQLGEMINQIHTDNTSASFMDAFTAENGDRMAIFTTGKLGEDGMPITFTKNFGKVKTDYNKSVNKDAMEKAFNEKATQMSLEKTRKRLDNQKTAKLKNSDGTYNASANMSKKTPKINFQGVDRFDLDI
jgi:hypothetical protein